MTDFLDAITRNPDDNSARLVWADALEEQGDLRGEYLRLEVRWRAARAKQPGDEHWESVLLTSGPLKINCIKNLRAITNFGLKDAKDIADKAPHRILANLTLREAEAQRLYVQRVKGAHAEVRRMKDAPAPNEVDSMWLRLNELSEQLPADWLRAVNRFQALWYGVPTEEVGKKIDALLGPQSRTDFYRALEDLSRPNEVWEVRRQTLREGLEHEVAAQALALFGPSDVAELRPSKCFFDWPAGC